MNCPHCGHELAMVTLTKKQAELLSFLRACRDKGFGASFDEMKAAVGLKSKSGIARLLDGLEERGRVKRLRHRARAIEVIG